MKREEFFKSEKYKDFIEALDISEGKYDRNDVFKDLIIVIALGLSNRIKYNEKNEQYALKVMDKYEGNKVAFVLLGHKLKQLYYKCEGIADILGHIYLDLSLKNKSLKQDFTPINLAKIMNEIQVKLRNDKKIIKEKGFVTVEDSCCGSGVLLLERANVLKKEGFNPKSELLVIANDIDPICAYMTYIQLCIYEIPGVVTIGNPLIRDIKETFYTNELLAIDLNIEQETEEKEIEE